MHLEKELVRPSIETRSVQMPAGEYLLDADLTVPINATGFIIFSQGNGHVRSHPHNLAMANVLKKYRLATMLADFSGIMKDTTLNVSLMAERLKLVSSWAEKNPVTENYPVGYLAFGSGTEAALTAAVRQPDRAKALVLLDGRPDRFTDFLPLVKVPVMLIAGGRDPEGLRSSQSALNKLNSDSTLNVISQASQSFEEPGALEDAAELAALWFSEHL